jgi:peptidoglycan/LPS O-acetylase OafA/YrhL
MTTDTKERVFGFDILRCIAILFVLFSHTSFMLPATERQKDIYLVYFGFTGVEIFFVLSGFLVGRIFLELIAGRSFSLPLLRYFWVRRWFRTLPAYYLSLILYTSLVYYTQHWCIFDIHSNLLFLVFLQNFWSPSPEFFRHAWSLSVEEWFYLLLPLWIWLFYRFIKVRNITLSGILACIGLITALRVLIVIVYNPVWNLSVRAITPLRLDSLMMGVLSAYIYLHYKEQWKKYAGICFIAGLIITLFASAWLYIDVIRHPDAAGFFSKTFFFNVFTGGIALCMPYMSSVRNARVKIIGGFVTYVSIVSYSLYLLHVLFMYVYLTVCYKFGFPETLLVRFWGTWIVCLIGAGVMYRFFEKPCTDLRDRFKWSGVRVKPGS